MFIRQAGDGNYYVSRIPQGTGNRGIGRRGRKSYKNIFLIHNKSNESASGSINVGSVIFPQEFVGKRVRLKVEIA